MKILIFGASGMIGHRVWLEARTIWGDNVFGVLRQPKSQFQKYNIFNQNIIENLDVINWEKTEELLNQIKPDVIVNAIGITIRKPEMADLQKALEINSFFPHRLLKWSQRNNSKVIHFSTDCVFDGASGHYLETSNPSAQDNYGRTKFLGEIVDHGALTLRFSCIGRELQSHTELLDWFLSQRGKRVLGYDRAMYSGVTSHVVAKEVCKIIENHSALYGLFQLSSAPISKYDLLCLAREQFDLQVEIEVYSDYISDKTLTCDKYKAATGHNSATWSQMMKDLYSDKQVKYNEY